MNSNMPDVNIRNTLIKVGIYLYLCISNIYENIIIYLMMTYSPNYSIAKYKYLCFKIWTIYVYSIWDNFQTKI